MLERQLRFSKNLSNSEIAQRINITKKTVVTFMFTLQPHPRPPPRTLLKPAVTVGETPFHKLAQPTVLYNLISPITLDYNKGIGNSVSDM